jgi:DNA-binding MarR family transcriptional regulator
MTRINKPKPVRRDCRPSHVPDEASESPLILDEFVPYRFSILAKRLSDTFSREYAERFDLTIPEWRVMAVLGPNGQLSANGVCDRTLMDKVTVSRAVARLVESGRLARRIDEADRRSALLRLTAKGRATYGKIVPLARGYESRLLAGLSDRDRALLDRLLQRMGEGLDGLENR